MCMDERPISKSERTRQAILAAARRLFAERGYELASIREIAALADIDPAMVIRYFGGKDELFARASVFDLRVPDLSDVPPGEIGAAIVLHFLAMWEGELSNGSLVVLLRSAASNEYAANRVREIFAAQVVPVLAARGAADADERAGLVSSQLLGLALGRYILKLPPLVSMSPGQIVARVGPTIQRYLSDN